VHAVNTGILSGVIGHWLDLGMHTILELALTGCLHDIGKTRIPAHILNKKGRLTQTEWKIVKEHPVIGAAILYKTKWIMPSVIMGVLRHHERLDGSGYPGKCLGSEIPLYARIVAVAEAFDTVTSIRPYARAMTTFEAVAHLRDQSFGQLDAMITRTLYDKVLEYYMGKPVQLSNGDTGVIIYLDQKLPRPVS
jgi:HD-GYP domain-containing protein (c-di-GMP phosphodiesterase class II)